MAESPAHRFGQIVGEVLEAAIRPLLKKFARAHGLYLDQKRSRPSRRGKKCSWKDANGNTHDLDYVMERGGTPNKVGMPAAFIETAWRRYTKHSRAKAQEIQGAIEPLAATFSAVWPFKGAILAGVFTRGALDQLRSLGFNVVYFPTESVVQAFQRFGIDARIDEDTPDAYSQKQVDVFERMSGSEKTPLAAALIRAHQKEVDTFIKDLTLVVSRQIERIIILALHGDSQEAATIDDAIRFIEAYQDQGVQKPVDRYEIEVRYNNGDVVRGHFKDKSSAVDFLRTYQPVSVGAN